MDAKRGASRLPLRAVLGLMATACLAGSEPTATAPNPSGLLVTPYWTALEPGASLQLTASVVLPGGDTVSIGAAAWSSAGAGVARVDPTGLVTAVAPGVDTIVASFGQVGGYAVIAVGPPVLVGAGDIADCNLASRLATAAALDTIAGVVFTAGDNAYQDGTTQDYARCYAPSWGRQRARTRPTPGAHDYHTPGAYPYFAYFGANAGDSGKGYYSYELGTWHVIAINSNIGHGAGSPQEQWLRADLAAHATQCTVAYWYAPRFSSGVHGNDVTMTAIWQALYDAGADVVISGHDHIYERFAPQTPNGTSDVTRGIREFVVGTGGADLTAVAHVRPNSEVRITGMYGVLKLSLQPTGYSWRFVPARGATTTDSSSASCH
jgi:hypothetical protein